MLSKQIRFRRSVCDGSDGVTVENDIGKGDEHAVTEIGFGGL